MLYHLADVNRGQNCTKMHHSKVTTRFIILNTVFTHFIDVYFELDYAANFVQHLRHVIHLEGNPSKMHLYQAIKQPCQSENRRFY